MENDIAEAKITNARTWNKRTVLQKKLPSEVFDPVSDPVFKTNKSGFVTERPIEWMVAMEKYISNENDVRARWLYKVDEEDYICECEITTWFQTTTEVTVSIIIPTGVFIVQGQHHRKFVTSEFNKIRCHMKDCAPLPSEASPDNSPNPEMEGMWDNIEKNKNAILGVESSIVKIFEIIKQTDAKNDNINNLRQKESPDAKDIEKKYDEHECI